MVYKTCSINQIIARVFRDFKPSHSGWIDDCVEWIADAIDIMKCGGSYGEQSKTLEVIDYRAKLPCDLDTILGVSKDGKRMARSGGFNHKNLKNSCVNTLPQDLNTTYTLTPNYINTSFEEGCITVYYLGIETDCDGYPTIIDDALYKEALTWYILMKLLGRGFKHQVFTYKDALQSWEKMYPRAQNRCKFPDIDGYELFKKSYLGLVNANNPTTVFFNSADYKHVATDQNPNSLLQTFQILGTNTNNT